MRKLTCFPAKSPYRRYCVLTRRYSATFWGMALFLASSGLPGQFPAFAQRNGPPVLLEADPQRWLYENNEAFEQLSGSARSALEIRFGKKKNHLPGRNEGFTIAESAALEHLSLRPFAGGTDSLIPLPNILVNDPAADTTQFTQSETTLVLGSGANIVVGFNDSGSFLSSQSSRHFTGWARSSDGGATWVDKGAFRERAFGDAGDPVLARDNVTGTIYFCALFFSGPGLQVFRSTDDGDSFGPPVNAAPGFLGVNNADFVDKPWITVDNFPGPGQGNVYTAFRNFSGGTGAADRAGITFTRSTNGGNTFGPSRGLLLASGAVSNVQGAWVTVGPDHAVYVLWYDQNFTPRQIRMRKSTDQGLTFGPPVTVATLLSTGTNGNLGLEFRTNSFVQMIANPANNNLYAVYNDDVPGVDRADVFFKQSINGGATWSAPVRLNNDATTRDQWQPTLAVTPDGTRLFVGFMDRRLDNANRLIDTYGVIGNIDANTVTFGPNFRITSESFPAVFGVDPVVNTTYMGDYDQAVADENFFYYTWADNRLTSPNPPPRPRQPDVRFTKIPVAGPDPSPTLVFSSAIVSGGNGNGVVDPDECNNLAVAIQNLGSAAATGVTATLATTTPGVTITQPSSAYNDIAIGATETNLVPFQIRTAPNFVCGTVIPLTLTIRDTTGSDVTTFSVVSASSNYLFVSSGANAIVPGVLDTGNHADDATTSIVLPFPYTLYGQTFTSATVSSNGNLQFVSNSTAFGNVCLPATTFNSAILAHWDDLRTDGPGNGIFTSISGSAPNRIFNIEWRTVFFSNTAARADFEIRLYEGQQRFDIVYGTNALGGASATIGVQQGTGSSFTQYACDQAGSVTEGLRLAFEYITCTPGGGCLPFISGQPVFSQLGPVATFAQKEKTDASRL